MSLYTHTIYLLRESSKGPFLDDLESAGLVRGAGDQIEFLGFVTGRYESTNLESGLDVVTLTPDDTMFDEFLSERGNELVHAALGRCRHGAPAPALEPLALRPAEHRQLREPPPGIVWHETSRIRRGSDLPTGDVSS